jgi:hypothetical protein
MDIALDPNGGDNALGDGEFIPADGESIHSHFVPLDRKFPELDGDGSSKKVGQTPSKSHFAVMIHLFHTAAVYFGRPRSP